MRRSVACCAALLAAAAMLAACSGTPSAEHSTSGVVSTAVGEPGVRTVASGPGSDCGRVTYPEGGAVGNVVIAAGTITCTDAMAVIDRYFHDPALVHEGNTWSAQFDGWGCASPTAVAAQEYGYSTSCGRGADTVEIHSGGSTPAATPVSNDCDAAAISRDLGQQLNVQRCDGDWAYVNTGELGDASSLLRLVGGTWTRYTGFPSSFCRGEAASDGVPDAELSSFQPC